MQMGTWERRVAVEEGGVGVGERIVKEEDLVAAGDAPAPMSICIAMGGMGSQFSTKKG